PRRGLLGLVRGRLLALPLLRVELLLDARLLGPPLGGFLLLGLATLGVLGPALGGFSRLDLATLGRLLLLGCTELGLLCLAPGVLLGLDLTTLRVLLRGRFVPFALLLRRLRLLSLLLGTTLFRFL